MGEDPARYLGSPAAEESHEEKQEPPLTQYEIWWANLPLPAGRRPVLLLSRRAAYDYLDNVVVAEITTTIRGSETEVSLGRAEGLFRRSAANLDNLRTVPKRYVNERIGMLGAGRVREVKRALGVALGWQELLEP